MSKHEGKTKEQLLELVDDLEEEIDRLEMELANAEDVSINEFSDEEVRSEYEDRDLGALAEDVQELFHAFYMGKTEKATQIARQIAAKHTGRIL